MEGYFWDLEFDQNNYCAGFSRRQNILTGNGIIILTATNAAGFTKIKAWDAGFFCLSVRNSGK